MADVHIRRLKRRSTKNSTPLQSVTEAKRCILDNANVPQPPPLSEEDVAVAKRNAEDGMAEKAKSFRALAKTLREETGDQPQTPSYVPIREDRERGHGPE